MWWWLWLRGRNLYLCAGFRYNHVWHGLYVCTWWPSTSALPCWAYCRFPLPPEGGCSTSGNKCSTWLFTPFLVFVVNWGRGHTPLTELLYHYVWNWAEICKVDFHVFVDCCFWSIRLIQFWFVNPSCIMLTYSVAFLMVFSSAQRCKSPLLAWSLHILYKIIWPNLYVP